MGQDAAEKDFEQFRQRFFKDVLDRVPKNFVEYNDIVNRLLVDSICQSRPDRDRGVQQPPSGAYRLVQEYVRDPHGVHGVRLSDRLLYELETVSFGQDVRDLRMRRDAGDMAQLERRGVVPGAGVDFSPAGGQIAGQLNRVVRTNLGVHPRALEEAVGSWLVEMSEGYVAASKGWDYAEYERRCDQVVCVLSEMTDPGSSASSLAISDEHFEKIEHVLSSPWDRDNPAISPMGAVLAGLSSRNRRQREDPARLAGMMTDEKGVLAARVSNPDVARGLPTWGAHRGPEVSSPAQRVDISAIPTREVPTAMRLPRLRCSAVLETSWADETAPAPQDDEPSP